MARTLVPRLSIDDQRRQALRLLLKRGFSNKDRIREELTEQGFKVTKAQVTLDLKAIQEDDERLERWRKNATAGLAPAKGRKRP